MIALKGKKCPNCGRWTLRHIRKNPYGCSRCGPEVKIDPAAKKPTGMKIVRSVTEPEPVEINEDVRTMCTDLLPRLCDLSQHEGAILAVLISADRPLRPKQMSLLTRVPRTKVYGVLKKLREAGLVENVMRDLDEGELPPIWEYWSDWRQKEYLRNQNIGNLCYVPRLDPLAAALGAARSELRTLEERYGRLMRAIE